MNSIGEERTLNAEAPQLPPNPRLTIEKISFPVCLCNYTQHRQKTKKELSSTQVLRGWALIAPDEVII